MAWGFADCLLDIDRQELYRDGSPVAIEPQALRILAELIDHRDRVVAKTELLDVVWGDRFVSESALTTQIKALRRAVGDTGREQKIVKTIHGRGYMLVADVEEVQLNARPSGDEAEVQDRANPVIAVLPFRSLSVDPAHAHIAEGLTHDIVNMLSKHRWLKVLTRTAVNRFRDEPDAVARLQEDLNVDYVVEGTVRRVDSRLRVAVNLSDAVDGTSRWAESFDRDFEDLFAVQDEITHMIAANVEPAVGYAERERVTRSSQTDLRAWDLYHLGVAHFFRFTAEDNLEAQRLLARSRELDPSFGDAHAWWAYATVLGMVYWDTEPAPGTLDEALAATQQALDVDGHNAVFHALRGRVQLARREYAHALHDNQRALELNPTFAAAWCGLGDSLCYEGRYEEAHEQFERAVALSAHDPQLWAFLSYGALALIFDHRFEDALEWAEQAATIPNRQYWTLAHRVVALGHLGRTEETRAAVDELIREQPAFTQAFARRKLFYLKRPEQLELYLDGLAKAEVPEG